MSHTELCTLLRWSVVTVPGQYSSPDATTLGLHCHDLSGVWLLTCGQIFSLFNLSPILFLLTTIPTLPLSHFTSLPTLPLSHVTSHFTSSGPTGYSHSDTILQRSAGKCHRLEQHRPGSTNSHPHVHARLLLDQLAPSCTERNDDIIVCNPTMCGCLGVHSIKFFK